MSFFDRFKISNKSNEVVNPASEESITLLRRILKFVESLGNVDIATRQRITLDAITAGLTLPTVTTVGTVTTVTNPVPVGNVATIASLDQRQFMDTARIAYNTGIRSRLN